MKKVITVILSLVMLITVSMGTVTGYAAEKNTIISPETTHKKVIIKVTLNGEDSHQTSYKPDKDNPNIITFTYTGDGELVGWDFPGEVEGVDYIILNQDGDSITILVLDGFDDEVFWGNAVDKYPSSTTTKSPAKQDNSSKSPNTGASTGLAVAGAGLAILMATKKRK